ncbi:MAG TPA: hypothetical protein VMU69_26880 [Bradyrhizobium sp.]|nr:hypothetical protein [Bradyrhizobium sp.]
MSAPNWFPRRTQKYVEALVEEGDNFDHDAWLKRVQQEEAAASRDDTSIASDDIKSDIIGSQKSVATSFLSKRASCLASVNEWQRNRQFPKLLQPRRLAHRTSNVDRRILAVEAVWNAIKTKRKRDAIFSYLAAVYELGAEYQRRGRVKNLLRYAANIIGFRVGDPFSAIIRCTCDADTDRKMVSRWSRALRYVAEHKSSATPLKDFMQRKGGINACANRFARMRKRRVRQ